MIFKSKKHNYNLYNTLLYLSRNLFFYSKIKLKDTFETRVYLIFFHFSIILTVFKNKKINFSQQNYDNFFYCIENDLRELGFGDVSVNKKMKNMNKIFYDILYILKFNIINYTSLRIVLYMSNVLALESSESVYFGSQKYGIVFAIN